MNKLPSVTSSVETLVAKQEAVDTVSGLIERNLELEDIFEALQPLLYALSVKLYGDDSEPVSLGKLVIDAVAYLNPDILDIKVK